MDGSSMQAEVCFFNKYEYKEMEISTTSGKSFASLKSQ